MVDSAVYCLIDFDVNLMNVVSFESISFWAPVAVQVFKIFVTGGASLVNIPLIS